MVWKIHYTEIPFEHLGQGFTKQGNTYETFAGDLVTIYQRKPHEGKLDGILRLHMYRKQMVCKHHSTEIHFGHFGQGLIKQRQT